MGHAVAVHVDDTPAWAGGEPGKPTPSIFGAAKPPAPPLTGATAWRYSCEDDREAPDLAVPDPPSCRHPWETDATAAVRSLGRAVALANGDGWQAADDFGGAGDPGAASRAEFVAAFRHQFG